MTFPVRRYAFRSSIVTAERGDVLRQIVRIEQRGIDGLGRLRFPKQSTKCNAKMHFIQPVRCFRANFRVFLHYMPRYIPLQYRVDPDIRADVECECLILKAFTVS